jgi:hypothetical protein
MVSVATLARWLGGSALSMAASRIIREAVPRFIPDERDPGYRQQLDLEQCFVSMTPKGTVPSTSRRVTYEIVVRGELSERFASTFLSESLGSSVGPARVEPGHGTTAIVIEVIDQTHLLAVLERLRDLSLEIERVNPAHESGRGTR